jgi:hypothetical protein
VRSLKTLNGEKKIGGYEIDIYFPDYKIGIELDGYYWHKNKNHKDLQKDREILKLGIQLYRLREVGLIRLNEKNVNYKHSEDDFDIIKRLLNNILNRAVDSHIKLNKPSHEQLNNFAGKLTDRPPCGKAAG